MTANMCTDGLAYGLATIETDKTKEFAYNTRKMALS